MQCLFVVAVTSKFVAIGSLFDHKHPIFHFFENPKVEFRPSDCTFRAWDHV